MWRGTVAVALVAALSVGVARRDTIGWAASHALALMPGAGRAPGPVTMTGPRAAASKGGALARRPPDSTVTVRGRRPERLAAALALLFIGAQPRR